MENKKTDWKFIIGTAVLVVVLGLIIGGFWYTVADQAEEVKREEARQEAEAVTAVYVYVGDVLKTGVLVDMATNQVFLASVPKEGIYNKNGTLIKGDVLEEGDMIRIFGDHVLTEDNPPVYQNITRMERTGRATLEQADAWRRTAEAVLTEEELTS